MAVLEKYNTGQPPSVPLWIEEVLPSPGTLLRPLGQAGTDGSGHLMLSCWELQQEKIPSTAKGTPWQG